MFLLLNKLITEDEICETSTQNLQQNNVARQVEPYFVALRDIQSKLILHGIM